MFLLQLLQQRIKLTPYGLFDIDLGLFSMVRIGMRGGLGQQTFNVGCFDVFVADYGSNCDIHSDINSVRYLAENIKSRT